MLYKKITCWRFMLSLEARMDFGVILDVRWHLITDKHELIDDS